MRNFLAEVSEHKKQEIAERKTKRPLHIFKNELKQASGAFLSSLQGNGLKIIAEVKPKSPSLGDLKSALSLEDRLRVYEQYAQAVSVLCDEKYFGGSVATLAQISASIKLPTLLKDFVLDPYQIYEAREAGAEAVLIIVKMLDEDSLCELCAVVRELGMTPIVEVQTEDELRLSRCVQPELLLINNRNLETLQMDLNTVPRLVEFMRQNQGDYKNSIAIAASGIENMDQLLKTRPYSSRFLIGSSLMSSPDPAEKFREFQAAERSFTERGGQLDHARH